MERIPILRMGQFLLVTVQVNTASGQTLSNTLSAGATTYDPHPLNNTATVDTAVS